MQDTVSGGNYKNMRKGKGNPRGKSTRGNYTQEKTGSNPKGSTTRGNYVNRTTDNGSDLEDVGILKADKQGIMGQFSGNAKLCNEGSHKKQSYAKSGDDLTAINKKHTGAGVTKRMAKVKRVKGKLIGRIADDSMDRSIAGQQRYEKVHAYEKKLGKYRGKKHKGK